MTITIAPQTEAKLKVITRREGREVNALADALLVALVEAADRDFEEACEAIADAMASNPKHHISLEDYRAQFEAEREARRRRPEGLKDKVAARAERRHTFTFRSARAVGSTRDKQN